MITEREDGRIESISLPWNREDVKYIAESWFDEPIKLTEDDIDYVLTQIEANFDASLGISWETIAFYVYEFKEDK